MFSCRTCRTEINSRQNKQSGLCLFCRKRKNAHFKNVDNKKSIEWCRQLGTKFGYRCLSEEYVNSQQKLIWQCDKSHVWEQRYGHIERGHGCPQCAGKKKHTIEDAQALASRNSGTCLSDKYVNNKAELRWKCSKGHTWGASFKDVNEGHWCGYCTSGRTEKKVRVIFECMTGEKFPSARPTWLKNSLCKRALQLDGYNEKLKLAFEYDGEFHYRQHPKSKDSLDKRRTYDKIKDELCSLNGVKLIRVPFTESGHLENYIREQLGETR